MPGAAGWLGSKLDQSAAMLRSVAEDWLPSRKLDAKLHELDMRKTSNARSGATKPSAARSANKASVVPVASAAR